MRNVFGTASRVLEQASRVLMYASAGCTPLAALRDGIRTQWGGFFREKEQIESGFFTGERRVADTWVPSGARILLIGCGTGRDLIEFVRRGWRVTGIDPAETALAQAREELRQRGLSASLERGFVEDHPLAGEFDVVWFSWNSYSYIPGSSRRIATLRRLLPHLAPGGRIVISHIAHRRPPRTRALCAGQWAGRVCRTDWRLEEGDRVSWYGAGTPYFHYEHVFGPGEVEREAMAAGLRALEVSAVDSLAVLEREPGPSMPMPKP